VVFILLDEWWIVGGEMWIEGLLFKAFLIENKEGVHFDNEIVVKYI
jgi:hypothetical protein